MRVLLVLLACCFTLPSTLKAEPGGVSPILVERFDAAAQTAQAGSNTEALAMYEKLFEPATDGAELEYVDEFAFEVALRRTYCLMDLGRYADARRIFEAPETGKLLAKMPPERKSSYYFAFGNTLGNLKDLETMHSVLLKAVDVAMNELKDKNKAEEAWASLLARTQEAEDWPLLEKFCLEAHGFGVQNEAYVVQVKAGESVCFAYRGLKQFDKARARAEKVMEFYRGDTSPENKDWNTAQLAKWKQFIDSLPK